MNLKQINEELKSLTIAVQSGNVHRRLHSVKMRHNKLSQPVATLLIPNRLFLLWSKKRSLPYCEGCNSVFKHSELANLSLENGVTLADCVEERLAKKASNIAIRHKKARGLTRAKLEDGTSHLMVFENEITYTTTIATVATADNLTTLVSPSEPTMSTYN